jgi:hypothetical protein
LGTTGTADMKQAVKQYRKSGFWAWKFQVLYNALLCVNRCTADISPLFEPISFVSTKLVCKVPDLPRPETQENIHRWQENKNEHIRDRERSDTQSNEFSYNSIYAKEGNWKRTAQATKSRGLRAINCDYQLSNLINGINVILQTVHIFLYVTRW